MNHFKGSELRVFCKCPSSSFRTGVKKPPLAPKPKLPTTNKPSPPPIAPKPGLLNQTSVISQHSPATHKRTKPAVAPKPCIPKSTTPSPPVSPPPPKPSEPLILSQEQQDTLDNSLSLLNSKNGILSETGNKELDYIIPTFSRGLKDGTENGSPTENGSDLHKELLQNGICTKGFTGTRLQQKAENRDEGVAVEKGEGGEISKKQRDKPQRRRNLDRRLENKEAQRTEEQKGETSETVEHQEAGVADPDVLKANVVCQSACDVAGSIIIFSSVSPHESFAESFEVEYSKPISKASSTTLHPDLQVPAAPRKPLPVPHPRKLKKPSLVRQDGVEFSAQDQAAEEQRQAQDIQETEENLSLCLSSEGEEHKQDTSDDLLHLKNPCGEDDVPDAPVPPPRQTSLSPRLHRTARAPSSLNKNTSQSLDLLSQSDSKSHLGETRGERVQEDEEDGYGDFERYPFAHSLPKQIKHGCHPPAVMKKAFSTEGQQSQRAPPRKPQRHSLPAHPSICPPAPPHANTPMRELPAPPQEKTTWRFTRPCVTFFSRQMPTRSSVPPKSRTPALGGKQRAQSFSAADLAPRANSEKRSLSFRKLLELRLSVKMLPKLLAKGGQSLDCTTGDSNGEGRSPERPKSCIGEADICEEAGEESVEYENVPLYEEIPEYMNLPFHSARLGWPHDPDAADSDIYEVQDPYPRCTEHEYERYVCEHPAAGIFCTS